MKNSFGTHLILTLFGESHGPAVGAVLDGLAPGLPVEEEFIAAQLALRRPAGALGTARREPDRFSILSGVFQGRTTGTPLCITIPNEDIRPADYDAVRTLPRPGHADYTAHLKYRGYEDWRGGGHFSGRLTAPIVAAGAVVLAALRRQGVVIGTHLSRCAGIPDRPFSESPEGLAADLARLNAAPFAVLDDEAAGQMRAAILAAAAEGDSVGGVLETAVTGLPAGLGEPWFDSVEGLLSHALFGIPAVKGVEFGAGFGLADARGSVWNDPFRMENGRVVTASNHNGGVNGGITNGMPVVFRCLVKPTPSIALPQETVDLVRGEDATLTLGGRHDPAILHRARVVVDSIAALVFCDLLCGRFGADWLAEGGAV